MRQFLVLILFFTLAGCSSSTPAVTVTSTAISNAAALPTAAATMPPGTLVYVIDTQNSVIKYVATGILNSQYPGTFKVTGQTLAFVPDGKGYRVQLALTFDLTSATAIDSFMRSTLLNSLQVDQFPVATLNLTADVTTSLQPDALKSAAFTLVGLYTLHGHQKPVTLPVTITAVKDGLQLNGGMTFNLSDYDVHVPAVLVNDSISFTAELSAKLAPDNDQSPHSSTQPDTTF